MDYVLIAYSMQALLNRFRRIGVASACANSGTMTIHLNQMPPVRIIYPSIRVKSLESHAADIPVKQRIKSATGKMRYSVKPLIACRWSNGLNNSLRFCV